MRGTRRTETGLVEIGDIITKVEDMAINTEADLFQALESYKPGDRVKVTVARIDTTGVGQGLKSKDVVLTVMLKASSDVTQPSSLIVPYRMTPQ
jgi:S1-C subfamily serine protease